MKRGLSIMIMAVLNALFMPVAEASVPYRSEVESFQTLSKHTKQILVGEVLDKIYEIKRTEEFEERTLGDRKPRISGKHPHIQYTVKVHEVLLGDTVSEVTIRHYGGEFGDGRKMGVACPSMPELEVGTMYVLFLAGEKSFCPFAGWSLGVYKIQPDETVLNYFNQPVDIADGKIKRIETPITLDEFKNHIRNAFAR